ncbi:unnamed protein product [Adineta steineri]|uniref:Uncharacterized protein n=1 Tax=Adineta steineri TaxID=433720 RepID=A0A818LKE5_9BILA|nr:unnamed protein product [Adineta steineri]CAF3574323.1 unnamed protein product [Adineta steineri]
MASSGNPFKTNLFGQLKSYSNAVQGVFEQRIARPILAFKRDLSRPTSETRVPTDQELPTSYHTRQGSTSSSSPLEIIDIDTSGSIKSIFDKVKNTLSPSTKRRTSNNIINDEIKKNSSKENDLTLTNSSSNKDLRKHHLHNCKSVSFADDITSDSDSDSNNQYSSVDRNKIVQNAHTLADQILMESIDRATMKKLSNITDDDADNNFEQDFHRTIKPRRIRTDDIEDLVYQDLSAEIVAYILKHALRTLKKEQEQSILSIKNETITNQTEENDDFIDLK